ncbi:hypothetical protein R3P38DRAFT_2869574 [Favolaschia claudopus]|uniref:G-patch domain-containing protein n=1 Tax=Favolaschia claudopus TaxID=2862362 RepID=A0AAW0DBE8_9AGAR
MPLDGHSYLVSQGWTGSGTGLREGAISRPLAIPQKKTLAGLGKDRDEAFPFWDHLFSAASKSITIKVSNDSDASDDSDGEPDANLSLKRTSTGILSNRRPVVGTSADTSGTTTPNDDGTPRLSLLATAKREAAKRNLYSRFFRGPVLGPDSSEIPAVVVVPPISLLESVDEKPRKKKRKVSDVEDEERRERKRLRKEKRELKEKKRMEKASKKSLEKGKSKETADAVVSVSSDPEIPKEKKRKRKREAEGDTVEAPEQLSKRKRKKETEEKEKEGAEQEKEMRKKRKRKEPKEDSEEKAAKEQRKRTRDKAREDS